MTSNVDTKWCMRFDSSTKNTLCFNSAAKLKGVLSDIFQKIYIIPNLSTALNSVSKNSLWWMFLYYLFLFNLSGILVQYCITRLKIINITSTSYPSGWPAGECYRLVSQSPGLRMLALRHRCQHSDAQPAVSGAFCGRGGKIAEILYYIIISYYFPFSS